MADDWIKARKKLTKDPRVLRVCRTLNVPRTQILGCLWEMWAYADDHADADGFVMGMLSEELDSLVGVPGFTKALPPEWMKVEPGGIRFPDYSSHNGSTAKARALAVKRQQRFRNGAPSTTALPEKIREEVKTLSTAPPPTPSKPAREPPWSSKWLPEIRKLVDFESTDGELCKALNAFKGIAGEGAAQALMRELFGRGWKAENREHLYAYFTAALKSKVPQGAERQTQWGE